jgi:ABC-type glycerol-3-phosphate transport system permease component
MTGRNDAAGARGTLALSLRQPWFGAKGREIQGEAAPALANFADINAQVDLVRTLINSGIFTGGVLLATFFLGLLAGYALAQLEFRGRSAVFNAMMLILVLPFQRKDRDRRN